MGVFENLAIHYIDYLHYFYSIVDIKSHFTQLRGYSVPCCYDSIGTLQDNVSFVVHCSYAEKFNSQLIYNFTNGSIDLTDRDLSVSSPTVHIDKSTGLSAPPPIVYSQNNGLKSVFHDSLLSSMLSLLNVCLDNYSLEQDPCADHISHNLKYLDLFSNIVKSR